MLGDVIGEGKGKRTARRVVAIEPLFKVEVSMAVSTESAKACSRPWRAKR